jgi:YXWGXW repeat-containing protein
MGLSLVAHTGRRLGAALLLLGVSACLPLPPAGVVLVDQGPPPERVEVVPVGPGAGYVWMRGYWGWNHFAFVWMPGSWAALGHGYQQWVPGRWIHSRRGWYWMDGHWR